MSKYQLYALVDKELGQVNTVYYWEKYLHTESKSELK